MKVSLSWIKDLLNIKISNKKIINQLIMLGIEVENLKYLYKYIYMKNNLIVGTIIDYKEYIKKKIVYTIKFGDDLIVDIISSKDVKSYLKKKIIVILNNRYVNLDKEKIYLLSFNKIYHRYLPGDFFVYNYFNMTEGEHSLSHIVEIGDNIPLGMLLNKKLNINDKWIKISIAFNRSDLKNLIGICREIYAYNNKKYLLDNKYILSEKISNVNITNNRELSIKVNTDTNFFYYVGILIKNLKYKFNNIPFWMYNRLLITDSFNKNPLINIINYVFIETGVIINIYDLDIIGKELTISSIIDINSNEKYKETILYDKETFLFTINNKNNILYNVGKHYISKNFIKDESKNLYIESISLTNDFIQKYINDSINDKQKDKLNSCLVDSKLILYAINRVTKLITKFFSGNIGSINIIGTKNTSLLPYKIDLPINKIKDYIGKSICIKKIQNIFNCLNFKNNIIKNKYFEINPPNWRRDIKIHQDIISEILKYYGYDKIKLKDICLNNNVYNTKDEEKINYIDNLKYFLINKGYQEIITYSLLDIHLQKVLFKNTKKVIYIINSISNEFSCIRNSLLNGLIYNIIYNQNYQNNRIKVFELGLCYEKKIINKDNNKKILYYLNEEEIIKEKFMLSGAIYGNKNDRKWCNKNKLPDIFDIKGDIENIFEILKINTDKIMYYTPIEKDNIFEKNIYGYINYEKKYIGKYGILNKNMLNKIKIKNQVIYFELNINKILKIIYKKNTNYFPHISYLPIYERDISLVVNKEISSNMIIKECQNILKKYLLHIEVFDIYIDNIMNINNEKSIGINIILQDKNKTLNNKEINMIINKSIKKLSNKIQLKIRKH